MATKLTDAKLKALPSPVVGQAEYSDSDVTGLRVRVGATGAKTFILRKRVAGRIRNITIGRYGPRFGLADARRKARSLLSDIEAGKALMPASARAAPGMETLRAMLPQYLSAKAHLRSADDIGRILRGYVVPEFGDRLADTITRGEVTALVDSVARDAPAMARAVHAQLSAFYTWALPRLDRMQANPCRDAGRPAKAKARDRVLTDDELAGLWRVAEAEALPWGPALQLLILTGARREEVFAADRVEFDLAAAEWVIPPARSKNGVANIVPLSAASIAVVKRIPVVDGSAKLFWSRGSIGDGDRGPSGFSKAQARFRVSLDKDLKRAAGGHWTLHDIRRTVATGLQQLGTRFEVTEAVLNHVSGAKGGIAGVYQRYNWKAEKREALDLWALHLLGLLKMDHANVKTRRGNANKS